MYIIQPVTNMALFRCILVLLINMTTVTVQLCVLFTQSEVRFVMVKLQAFPAAFGMAISTFLAKTPLVDVIFFVARQADFRSVPIFFSLKMTSVTAGYCVCTLERIICGVMVKGIAAQLDDIRIAAFMISVTVFTLGFPGLRASMNTLPAHDVFINFFMTVSTKRALFVLAERLVAVVAFLFIFRMTLYNFAGHHQGFYASCYCAMHDSHQRDCHDSQENKNLFPHNGVCCS